MKNNIDIEMKRSVGIGKKKKTMGETLCPLMNPHCCNLSEAGIIAELLHEKEVPEL